MSTQEKLTWSTFVVVAAASAWLAWALFSAWPDTTSFAGDSAAVARPAMWAVLALLFAIFLAKTGLRRKEPYADERDAGILHAGNTQGFAALALMNVVLGIALVGDRGLLARLDPEWLRYLLLLQVGVAFAIASGYRLFRYRIG